MTKRKTTSVLISGGDTSSCLDPYPTAACPEFHVACRLGRELFTVCFRRCPWSHGRRPENLYHIRSVAVTPVLVRVPTQRLLVPSFMKARSEIFQTTLACVWNLAITKEDTPD